MSDRAEMFTTIHPGYGGGDEPVTPRNVPNRGGSENPSGAALRAKFGAAVQRVEVVNGETTVLLDMGRMHEAVQWLHDDAEQSYEYLSDVTAVEHRDFARPIEAAELERTQVPDHFDWAREIAMLDRGYVGEIFVTLLRVVV